MKTSDAQRVVRGRFHRRGDPNRTRQEIKKTALDLANNNKSFTVQCGDVVGNTCP